MSCLAWEVDGKITADEQGTEEVGKSKIDQAFPCPIQPQYDIDSLPGRHPS